MTDEELDELETKAKAATSGPWIREGRLSIFGPHHEASRYDNHRIFLAKVSAGRNRDDSFFADDGPTITGDGNADAAYIAAANPATILNLLKALRKAWAERDWLIDYMVEKETLCLFSEEARNYCMSHDDCGGCPYLGKEVWLKAAKEAAEEEICQKS